MAEAKPGRDGSASRLLRFATVGVINTLADMGVFFALVQLTGLIVASNVVAYGCGTLVSFVLNRGWTFRDQSGGGSAGGQMVRFALLNAATLTLTTFVLLAVATVVPLAAAKFSAVAVGAIVSYLGMRHFVFEPGRAR